jgi:hypothetical protein
MVTIALTTVSLMLLRAHAAWKKGKPASAIGARHAFPTTFAAARQGTMTAPSRFERMPHYYLHIRKGEQLIADPEGIERPDLDTARGDALSEIRDLLAEAMKRGADDLLDDAIVIADEAGRELMTIPFNEGLPPRLYKALLNVLHAPSKSVLDP